MPARSIKAPVSRAVAPGLAPERIVPTTTSTRPSTSSGNPQGERVRSDNQIWESIGFSSTKSRLPLCTCFTRLPRLGRSKVLANPFSSV